MRLARLGRLAFLVALSIALAACGSNGGSATGNSSASNAVGVATPRAVKHVTFMAGFKPQANLPFVGAYVAQEKGFFKAEDLDVDIEHSPSGSGQLQLLLAGTIQFTTADGDQVVSRNDQGLPIVSIALIGQKSEQGYAVLANSGINSVKDWAGKTFGYKGSVPSEFLAMANAGGINPDQVKQVSVGFDVRVLTQGAVDILPVFFSNEVGQLADLGVQTKVFDPADYGIQSLGLTYVTSQDYAAKDPDAVERFLRAVLMGIAYANDHRDEALDIVMKYAPDEDRHHQQFMLDTELDGAVSDLTKTNGLGWQTQAQWQSVADTLLQYKAVKNPVDVSKVYTSTFLTQAYKNGKLVFP